MSVEHIAMVFAAGDMGPNEKALLLAYCNHTDPRGYCWPGIDRLADETGMSTRTVKRMNAALRARNLIKSVQRINPKTGMQITNLTRVNLPLLASLRRPDREYDDDLIEQITFEDEVASSQVSRGCQSVTPGGVNLSPPGGQADTRGGVNLSPKTSLEPSVEPSSSYASRSAAEGGGASQEEEAPETSDTLVGAKLVDQAVSQWSRHRPPDDREHLTLAERAVEALAQGASPEGVVYALTRDLEPSRTRSAVAVVMHRTTRPGWADQKPPAPARTETSDLPASRSAAEAIAATLAAARGGV